MQLSPNYIYPFVRFATTGSIGVSYTFVEDAYGYEAFPRNDWGELRAHAGSKAANTARELFLKILRGAKARGELEDEA